MNVPGVTLRGDGAPAPSSPERRDLWLVMARTGGDYEYTDWPIRWGFSEAEADACVADLAAAIEKLAASVPPCPDLDASEAVWDRYLRKERRARQRAEALDAGLDATFFTVRLVAARATGPASPLGNSGNTPDQDQRP